MADQLDVPAFAEELACENFPDARLTRRLERIVRAVGQDPSASLPSVLSTAELEGAYRFFANPLVSMDAILAPHLEATKARAAREPRIRVIHDQTEFTYRQDGKRSGLGNRAYQGFSGHFSLVVAANESRTPLGLAGVHTWVRGKTTQTEHSFWLQQIQATSRVLECGAKAVHVCDRGPEDYALFHALLAADHRFVMRVSNRYTESGPAGAHTRLRDVLATIDHVSERAATINGRRRHSKEIVRKIHPPREPRQVRLHMAAGAVVLARPPLYKETRARLAHLGERLQLNAVRVWEPEPPEGEQPIEWFLMTNEPIETAADVCAVVDHYRARWVIEEYFKALKTGCAFQQRQLHDYEGLMNALGVFAPLAYHVLRLRTQARATPEAPAHVVVSEDQLAVLRVLGRRDLPERPNARDALLAVAALGGHIKYAPDPGWLTIARGLEKLELLTAGWVAGKIQRSCDQR
jgi:hypothetical protein